MTAFRNLVFRLMVPMNIVMTLWVFAGRVVFMVPVAWMAVLSIFTALPVLVLMLVFTTVLATRQRRQPRLSPLQAWLQVLLWASLGLLGATIVDAVEEGLDIDLEGGISEPENLSSVMTRLVGWSPRAVLTSVELMYVFTATTVLLWVALAIALVAGARRPPPSDRR